MQWVWKSPPGTPDAGVVQGEGQVPGEGGACWVEDHGKASVVDTRVNVQDAIKIWRRWGSSNQRDGG